MPSYNNQRMRGFARRVTRRASRLGRFTFGVAALNSATRLYRRAKRDITIGRKARKLKENPMKTYTVGRPLKRPRSMAPPTSTAARVSARYAVANRMTKFKPVKATKMGKVPKSLGFHYKDYGEYNAERVMYINHEHWGSRHRFWATLGVGLTKTLLARGQLYPGKLLSDPVMGPRTNNSDIKRTFDNQTTIPLLKLTFINEANDGAQSFAENNVNLVDTTPNPDRYRSFQDISNDVATALQDRYDAPSGATYWLTAASIIDTAGLFVNPCNMINLEDAEISLYVKALLKFQNITPADGGGTTTDNIDRNPLEGRVYTAKGCTPRIDDDLAKAGDTSLDTYFGDQDTSGITLCGQQTVATSADIGRITHVPPARQLYSNMAVSSGVIHMTAGAMKFHKTTFTMKRTFRSLADVMKNDVSTNKQYYMFGAHTLFGLTPQHKHGDDSIKIGYNREIETSCFIKYNPKVHTIKTNFAVDQGLKAVATIPTEHADY